MEKIKKAFDRLLNRGEYYVKNQQRFEEKLTLLEQQCKDHIRDCELGLEQMLKSADN